MTGCAGSRYEQYETSLETIEQELRPVVCEQRPTDRVKENYYSIDMIVLKKTEWQGHEHLCHTGMPVRNGNLDTDRTTTTKATRVRKQLGTKHSMSNEGRQAKNGGVKGRDGSVEELDRETDEEQITVGWTRRNNGG